MSSLETRYETVNHSSTVFLLWSRLFHISAFSYSITVLICSKAFITFKRYILTKRAALGAGAKCPLFLASKVPLFTPFSVFFSSSNFLFSYALSPLSNDPFSLQICRPFKSYTSLARIDPFACNKQIRAKSALKLKQ